jgi:glycosyltransferase involved in cell wall biosynthesis
MMSYYTYYLIPNAFFITFIIIQYIIFFAWLYLLIYSVRSIKYVPKLNQQLPKTFKNVHFPLVSIILPSRNEEKYIEKCLDSMLKQDYPNFEIIAINDSSTDKTEELIKRYSNSSSKTATCKIIYVDAGPKPEGWTGKNWACYQGYLQSSGDLFLFTDADTTYNSSTISLAVTHLLSEKLDSITAIPKLLANDFLTKITLPILWTLSLARLPALKANNPKSKVGYFFGSFFIITRKAYETVGTHKSVKEEIIEDGELGRKVKEQGFSLRVVHGEEYIRALWARDSFTLWHALRRLVIPLYKKEKIKAYMIAFATFVLLLFPLIMLPFSIINFMDDEQKDVVNNQIMLFLTIASILLLVITSVLQLKYVLFQNPLYSIAFPLAVSFVFIAFLSPIISSSQKDAVRWQGRKYSIR